MIVPTLGADHYGTVRSVLVPDSVLNLLRAAEASRFHQVALTNGAYSGTFTVAQILNRCLAIQSERMRQILIRIDNSRDKRTVFGFQLYGGSFYIARSGLFALGCNPL